MELFCAGDVNSSTMFLALASVAAACNRYPQAETTVLMLLSRIQASNFGQNIDYIYACSTSRPPIHPQYLDNSCRMC